VRLRRSRERGQVVPLVALMFAVLAGFAALTIDAGVSYDQSRNDQDVSDSAALAATYSLNKGATLTAAYNAAQNVANLDCIGPSAPCGVTVNFYTSSNYTGTPACSATSSSASCLSSTTGVLYVGTSVSTTANNYFAHLAPAASRTHSIVSQAVAEVSSSGSSGSGSSSPNPTAACEICILGNVTFQASSDTLQAGGGNIDVGGYVYFDNSSDALKTSAGSGWGIAIDGTTTYNGYTVEYTGSSDSLSSAGILGIDGKVYFNSSSDSIAATGTLNISGTVKNNGSSNTISPASYGTATTAAFTDPLATTPAPSFTANGKTFSAPSYAVSGDTTDFPNNGAWSYPTSTCPSSDTISPGIYDSIIINCSSATLNFNPGVYVIAGGAITVNSSSDTLASPSGGVTIYYTCASGSAPASCGAFTSSTATCSSTTSGAQLTINGSSAHINLSGGYNGSDILMFYDPCNSNQHAYYGQNSSISYTGSGTFYAHSGGIWFDGSSAGVPGPLIADNVMFDSSSCTLGTASGSINLGTTTASSPGNLVK
jgi:hypothetical protein